ncbi:MAG: hypothetical protein AB9834_20220 [Lentimicrobium sp.]
MAQVANVRQSQNWCEMAQVSDLRQQRFVTATETEMAQVSDLLRQLRTGVKWNKSQTFARGQYIFYSGAFPDLTCCFPMPGALLSLNPILYFTIVKQIPAFVNQSPAFVNLTHSCLLAGVFLVQ